MTNEFLYKININEVLKKYLEELLNKTELVERFKYLNKNFHNLDFFVNELCLSLKEAKDEDEFKKYLLNYINKLETMEEYGFKKIGFPFDITGKVSDSSKLCSCTESFGDKKMIKVFTDGEKTNQKILNEDIVTIESSLENPSYWFNVHYFFEPNKESTIVIDDTLNIVNLDFDLNLLPTKNEIKNHALKQEKQKIKVKN